MSEDILLQMVANKRRGIDPFSALRGAVIKTAHLDPEAHFDIKPDSRSGQYKIIRHWTVVADAIEAELDTETVTLGVNEIPLKKALKHNPDAKIGDSLSQEIHFSRIEVQNFKRAFAAEMQRAERSQVTEAYRARIGEVLTGTIKHQQFSREGITLELEENVELLLPQDEMIPKEEIRLNDRVYVYLYDIDTEAKGPQLLVSRKAPNLLKELFRLKILEIDSGIIEVKAVARDPGFRAKVAVKTNDGRLNPIGTCIGRSGERIQAISNELNGEHIDIILWDDNPAQLAIHALAPAEVISITMDEDKQTMDILVRNEDLPRAIGRNGQNVRLASQLTGWTLNIMSAEEAEQKNIAACKELELQLVEQLNIEQQQAQRLIEKEITTLEEVVNIDPEELASLLSLDNNQLDALLNRANDLLLAEAFASESKAFQPVESDEDTLESIKGIDSELLSTLVANNIHSRELLAELSIDDLLDMTSLTREKAGKLIMDARAHWFKKSD